MKVMNRSKCVVAAMIVWGFFSYAASAQLSVADPFAQNKSPTVVERVAGMVDDADANFFAAKYQLDVLNVMWEDTGRYYGSAVGPNISDVTIQVQEKEDDDDTYRLTCMPVIRFPNFRDKTADIPLEEFFVLVGNQEKGKELRPISLKTYLGDIRHYLTDPDSWQGERRSLLADRDTHALVSAQACFLPIGASGKVEFSPVIFNYQSLEKNPAVLTVLATREGASATVIDNKRDAFTAGWSWGQRLLFNQHGQRATLTGQRKSDFETTQSDSGSDVPPTVGAAGEGGLNLVLLVQVPLKQKEPPRAAASPFVLGGGVGGMGGFGGAGVGGFGGSDVEEAVIGHGKVEGPFTEIDGLPIERDPRFPIRVTVQFYKATSNGVVSEEDMAEIAAQISRVYRDRDYVGSLVIDGPSERPTEHDDFKVEPPWWWASFWTRHERNTGMSRRETMKRLFEINGFGWRAGTRREMVRAVGTLDE